MWGVIDQIPNRGSVNVAYTINGREGLADAIAFLGEQMVAHLKGTPVDRAYQAAADALLREKLVPAMLGSVTCLPHFEPTALGQSKSLSGTNFSRTLPLMGRHATQPTYARVSTR